MKPGKSSASGKLLPFPPRPPEPVDAETLRRNSRLLLELADIELEMKSERRTWVRDWTRWKKLKKQATTERNLLLERLARGAKVAG